LEKSLGDRASGQHERTRQGCARNESCLAAKSSASYPRKRQQNTVEYPKKQFGLKLGRGRKNRKKKPKNGPQHPTKGGRDKVPQEGVLADLGPGEIQPPAKQREHGGIGRGKLFYMDCPGGGKRNERARGGVFKKKNGEGSDGHIHMQGM